MTFAAELLTTRPKALKFGRDVRILAWVTLCLVVFTVSMFLNQAYVDGDQKHYRAFYQAIAGLNLKDAYLLQGSMLNSGEPLYAGFMWVGAHLGINKDVYVSIANVVLALTMVKALHRWGASVLVISLFLGNFYLLVLMTGAERLKFSYILLFAAAASSGRWRYPFLTLAPLAHFQTFFNLAALAPNIVVRGLRARLKAERWMLNLCLSVVAVAGLIVGGFYLEGILLTKLEYYGTGLRGPTALAQWAMVTVWAALIVRRKQRLFFLMVPLAIATLIVGGERINMISFVMAFYAIMTDGRANHLLVYPVLGYFCFKSINFVQNILQNGHGFG
ncbi:hypothetical protein [Pelagibacterium mangrovi]|uniref:hypothetical protein n=1 Tax=Pelagibacterium mangrovi TaxID=3119828 RepID=UPI002FCA4A81